MNKLLINICIVLLSSCSYAMDENLRFQLNAQKNYGAIKQVSTIRKIQKSQDVSLMPLKDICKSVEALSSGLQAKIKQDLSQSWIFNVAMLLPEIKNKIILKMAENHEKVAQYLYEGPMLPRFAVYHDNWNSCFMTVGGKELSAQQVFVLPQDQRQTLVKIAKPSLARYLSGQYNSSTITFEDAQDLNKLPGDLLDNMKLTALIPESELVITIKKICFALGSALLFADTVSGIVYLVSGSDGSKIATMLCGVGSLWFCGFSVMVHCTGIHSRYEHAIEVEFNELGYVVVDKQ